MSRLWGKSENHLLPGVIGYYTLRSSSARYTYTHDNYALMMLLLLLLTMKILVNENFSVF
jgi:hypothetical protein